jgi:L-amino acid N-acyltransferase YncA
MCRYTMEERKEWFASHDVAKPVLVTEQNGKIVEWGALSLFKTACTFYKTVEHSVYVHHEFQHQGIGGKILFIYLQPESVKKRDK